MNTDPNAVRDMFASHYFLFAFLASLGTLQIAVVNSGIRGLWITPYRLVTRWLGVMLILTGIVLFFVQPMWIEGPWAAGSVEADSVTREIGTATWDELASARNVNDIHGGLDGMKQALWFPLAAILAFFVSAIAGSMNLKILNTGDKGSAEGSERKPENENVDGLAGLVDRSYFENLPISFKKFKTEIGEVWRSGINSSDRWSLIKMIAGRSSK